MQDSKNLIVAILLCLLVVVGWSYLAKEMGWGPKPATQEQIDEAQRQQAAQQAKQKLEAEQKALAASSPIPVFQESEGKDIIVRTPLYSATIYTGGGTLRSFELNKFRTSVEPGAPLVNVVNKASAAMAPLGLLVNGQPSWSIGKWSCDEKGDIDVSEGQTHTLVLRGQIGDMGVVRELTFSASTYKIDEVVRIVPSGSGAVSARLGYTVGADKSNAAGSQYDSMRIGYDNDGSLQEESDEEKLTKGSSGSGKIYWGAAMSTYFFNGILPKDPTGIIFKGVYQNGVYRVALEQPAFTLTPGQEQVFELSYWFGPKDRKLMGAVSDELAKSVDLGFFSLIGQGLLWILNFFYGFLGNWGLAIIMLTVVIKVVFWPLTAKSYSSMEKMKRLAPMMQKIKDKYKDDKEAMNRETMALYKTYGVNPASGCVPILIQMPVFFGLYQALLTSVELRHASFIDYLPGTDLLWLADLSAKDPFYITPIIMGASMLVQQLLTPQTMTGTQQKMMLLLPVVFTFLFLSFPSGLVVYWLANNIISIGQQAWMRRKPRREVMK